MNKNIINYQEISLVLDSFDFELNCAVDAMLVINFGLKWKFFEGSEYKFRQDF